MAIKETIPFNFDDTYAYVERKFVELGYDVEEGSNTMQLVTAMSYLTSMLNANTAVNINETLLPLARKRSMVLQDARVLGYELEHIRSYQYELTLNFTTLGTNIVKKFTSFTSGDYTYYYMGNEFEVEVTQADIDAGGKQQTLLVTEGELKRFTDDSETTLTLNIEPIQDELGNITAQHYIDIPFTNVEENGIEVYLTYYDEFAAFHNQELWQRSKTFMIDKDTVLNKEYVRLDNIDYNTPRLYFKLGDVGKEIRVGTIVQMNILRSNGAKGQMIELPNPSELDAQVLDFAVVLDGAAEESIESIKKNAPLFHNTANRVITKNDYIAFCNRLAKIKFTDVWDGHDEFPRKPGHIWFSFIPSNLSRKHIPNEDKTVWSLENPDDHENWFLDENTVYDSNTGVLTLDEDIQEVYDSLDRYRIPTLQFHHRNPIYVDFTYDVNVIKYTAVKTKAERNQEIFKVIDEYFKGFDENGVQTIETPVETFRFEYFQSNLNKRIDTKLTDLMGFNITLKTTVDVSTGNMIKEIPVDPSASPIVYYKEVRFHLGLPYEETVTTSGINTNNLPSIYTESFGALGVLDVDFTSGVEDVANLITTYNITLDGVIVGEYRVYAGVIGDIEVILYIQDTNGYTNGIPESALETDLFINVTYPSPNIKFARNTIPRLRQVNFV